MSGTILEIMRRRPAEYEAGVQYAKAIERHFDDAERLVREGKTDQAERIAKGAAILRIDARAELRGE